ncbi:aspartate aminotransferase family protein, partial [Salmonella enterica]
LRNLEIIEDEHLVERTRDDTGPNLAKALAERLAPHPLVGEARSLGLIGAVEIVAEKGTNRRFGAGGQAGPIVRDECIARGLMVRAIRDS